MPWGERGWSRCACTNGGLLHHRSESGARQRRYTLGNRSGKTLGFDCRTNENEAANDSRVDVKPGTFLWRWLDLEVSQGAVYGARKIFDGDGLGTSSHDCSFPIAAEDRGIVARFTRRTGARNCLTYTRGSARRTAIVSPGGPTGR